MLARKEQLCLQQQGQQGIFTGMCCVSSGAGHFPSEVGEGWVHANGQGAIRLARCPHTESIRERQGGVEPACCRRGALGAWGCPGRVPIRWDLELATDSSEPSLPSVWQGESKPRD